MDNALLDQLMSQFGYAAMFLALCMGIIGLPIPNEIVVMTAGAAAGTGYFLPVPAFLVTYSGVVSGLTFGYAMGRFFGLSIIRGLSRIGNKKRIEKFMSSYWVQRYDGIGLSFSYFIPMVRHLLPYFAGMNKMPYRRFAFFAYSSSFVWTLIYFLLGYYAGSHSSAIEDTLYRHGPTLLWLIVVLGAVIIIVRQTTQGKGMRDTREQANRSRRG